MSMTVRRYSVVLGATAVATLLVAMAAATLMLTGFRWFEDDSGAFAGNGWAIFIFLVRALLIPVMLYVVIRIGRSAITIIRGRREVFPPTANSAITYFGVTTVYISLGMIIPIFWTVLPALLEPILYPLPALLLLVVTIRSISKDGQLPGPPVVGPWMASMIVAAAWAVVIGASAAYAQFVLAGNAIEQCFAGECPPERTVGVMAFMAVAATVTAVAVMWSLRSPMRMTRLGIIGAVAFACLALLFPVTIMPSFVMPYDAFVPGFFYGIAAVAFLIVAVARKEEDPFQFATA